MSDTAPVARPRTLIDRLVGSIGQLFTGAECPPARRVRAANDEDGVIESAAALDGFIGPSNWLGWAGFGMDHLEPIDWRPESADERDDAPAHRARPSAFGD